MKVLLVEDDPLDRANYEEFIKSARQNVEVIVAYDALDANAQLAKCIPQIAIIDMFLPVEVSGLELVKAMKAHPRTKDVRIFALSTSHSPETADRARVAGCEDCFVKDRDVERLIDVIKNAPYP